MSDQILEEIEGKLQGAESHSRPSFVIATAHVAYLLAELREAHAAVRAARFVVSVREAELLKLKGPCSNNDCTLHYAHSGPCNEDRTQTRAAVADATGGERGHE